jgi:hypothetical protein
LIVNNENLDVIEDPAALNMLLDKIDTMKSTREFFNPKVF